MQLSIEESSDCCAPVLFLDVDGVLTTSRGLLMTYSASDNSLYHVSDLIPGSAPDSIPPLEKDRVSNLRTVVAAVPGLRIVVSSTWREDDEYMAFLLAALREGDIDVEAVVIDKTPVSTGGRGAEVREWLALNPSHNVFAIVDDGHAESFKEHGFEPQFVQTYVGCIHNEFEGLTREHAKSLIDILVCKKPVDVHQSSEAIAQGKHCLMPHDEKVHR